MWYKYARKVGIGLILILGTFNQCSEKTEVKPATYSLKLTGEDSKSWKLSQLSYVFDDPAQTPVDLTYLLAPCELDDIYSFYHVGKVLEITEGATKCNDQDPDLIARTTWDIVNANAQLIFGSANPYVLRKLTDDSLVYAQKDTVKFEIYPNVFEEVPGSYERVFLPVK